MSSQKYQTNYIIRNIKYPLEPLRREQIRMTADKAVHG